jgi:hypothetical protein
MSRQYFLTTASLIAFSVGLFALIAPKTLLESKGVEPVIGTFIWVKEVGLLLIAIGIIAFSIRKHEISPTLKAFLFGNIIIQIGLFLIELVAYLNGVITKLARIMPNLGLHVILAIGFAYHWFLMREKSN